MRLTKRDKQARQIPTWQWVILGSGLASLLIVVATQVDKIWFYILWATLFISSEYVAIVYKWLHDRHIKALKDHKRGLKRKHRSRKHV